jgi:ribosomal-protein-alanine N-acetyltransferase
MLLATVKDAPAIAALHKASFAKGWSEDDIANMLKEKDTFAIINAAKTGMIICKIAADEAEIYTICVHPDARGKGIGSALLTKALDIARGKGVRAMFLEVDATNTAALNLYKKAGFAKIGIRKAYYHHEVEEGKEGKAAAPTDAMVLKKQL